MFNTYLSFNILINYDTGNGKKNWSKPNRHFLMSCYISRETKTLRFPFPLNFYLFIYFCFTFYIFVFFKNCTVRLKLNRHVLCPVIFRGKPKLVPYSFPLFIVFFFSLCFSYRKVIIMVYLHKTCPSLNHFRQETVVDELKSRICDPKVHCVSHTMYTAVDFKASQSRLQLKKLSTPVEALRFSSMVGLKL